MFVGHCELALADPMRQLNSRQRDGGGPKRLQPKHRRAASLDRAVILLDDVIKIAARAHLDGLPARILLGEQPQPPMGCRAAIEIDLLRPPRTCRLDRLSKELLRRAYCSVFAKHGMDG